MHIFSTVCVDVGHKRIVKISNLCVPVLICTGVKY